MEDNHQLKLDLEELRYLQSIAQRRHIINLLNILSKNPRLFYDILNSEKKLPPPPQSSQSKESKSSAVSKIAATREVAASTTTTNTKKLENQQWHLGEVTSSAWRPKEEKKAYEHQLPNPERFSVSMKIPHYVEEYEGCISKGKQCKKVTVSLAGKITNKMQRFNSSNLFFYDLEGGGSKVQIVADASNSDLVESEFSRLHSYVMPGDLVGIVGFPVGYYYQEYDGEEELTAKTSYTAPNDGTY